MCADKTAAPVDMSLLLEVTDNDPQQLREIVELYLHESDGLIRKLETAIRTHAAAEVAQVAHTYAGASASCGLVAVVPSLRQLEHLGRTGQLAKAEQLYAEVRGGYERIARFLDDYLSRVGV